MLKPPSNNPKTSTYHNVILTCTLLNIAALSPLSVRGKDIALAAACVNQRPAGALVDLLSQPPNIDIDDIRERIEILVPHVTAYLVAPNQLARVQDKELEQRVLLCG